jgi:hypothetical protein
VHVRFETPHQYVFIHENVKHLLLIWSKESKKQLFIAEEEEDALVLRYPGETYTETVLEQVEPVFFLDLEGGVEAILGATFYHQNRLIGMYYDKKHPTGPPYFFEIEDGSPSEIPDEEYQAVAQTFAKEFPEYVSEEPEK